MPEGGCGRVCDVVARGEQKKGWNGSVSDMMQCARYPDLIIHMLPPRMVPHEYVLISKGQNYFQKGNGSTTS